jgi:hypothetical protein
VCAGHARIEDVVPKLLVARVTEKSRSLMGAYGRFSISSCSRGGARRVHPTTAKHVGVKPELLPDQSRAAIHGGELRSVRYTTRAADVGKTVSIAADPSGDMHDKPSPGKAIVSVARAV